jgi:hypothetical protein
MKQVEENRINSLHKDLMKRMFESGLQAQVIEDGSREQKKDFLEGLKELAGFSALVMMEEERSLFPGIISVAPFMIPLLEQEHLKVKELGERICVLADDYEESYTDNERMNTILQSRSAYCEWMAFVMQHLVKEEMIVKQAAIEVPSQEKFLALIAA